MTDMEAIKILGLPNSFTGIQEKNNYHRLANLYHPDIHLDDSSEEQKRCNEKMALINAAHDYLKNKYFADNNRDIRVNIGTSNSYSNPYNHSFWGYYWGYSSYNDNYNGFNNVPLYKREMIEKINEYVKGIDFYHFPKYINEIMNEIRVCAHIYIRHIEQSNTNGDIDYYFKEFKTRVCDSYYQTIILEYAKHNNVDSDFFKDKINFECNAIDFYKQLGNIAKQYKSKIFNERLTKETEKYKEYLGYLPLKGFIKNAIEETLLALRLSNVDSETSIQMMHATIIKEFERYFKEKLTEYANKYKNYAGYNEFVQIRITSKIGSYTSYVKNINFTGVILEDLIQQFQKEIEIIFASNFEMIENLNRIKKRMNDCTECLKVNCLNDLNEELRKCEKRFLQGYDITDRLQGIEQKLEVLLNMNENKEALNEAYNSLITNYYHKLVSMNPMDYKEVQKVNEIFDEAMEVFARIEAQEISIESAINVLPRITFNNYDEDSALLENASRIIIASGIYMKNPDYVNNNWLCDSFCYLKEEDDQYIMTDLGWLKDKKVMTEEEIKKDYISLEDFLKKAEYIGKEDYQSNSFIKDLVLYKYKNIYIVKYKMTHSFGIQKGIVGNLRTVLDYSEYGGDYKDPNKLIAAIKKQLELLISSCKVANKMNDYYQKSSDASFILKRRHK